MAAPPPWSTGRRASSGGGFPRFDSDLVFCCLIAGNVEKGFCDVLLAGQKESQSAYLRNSAVVTTLLTAEDGSQICVTDFAPRFRNFDRTLRPPPQLMRIIEPVSGVPRITIRLRPAQNYGKPMQRRVAGSNHITRGEPALIRLTTDAPLSYIEAEAPFALTRPVHLVIGPDEPFEGELCRHLPRFSWVAPMPIGRNGCAACPSPMNGRTPPSAPPSP